MFRVRAFRMQGWFAQEIGISDLGPTVKRGLGVEDPGVTGFRL